MSIDWNSHAEDDMDGPTLWSFMQDMKKENKAAHNAIIQGMQDTEKRVRVLETEQSRLKVVMTLVGGTAVGGAIAQAFGIDIQSL